MKLLVCDACGHCFSLTRERELSCPCGATSGKYCARGEVINHRGRGMVIAFANSAMQELRRQYFRRSGSLQGGMEIKAQTLPINMRGKTVKLPSS